MRIIGGTAKGHTIKAPKGMDTRPTLDRVRESIFNVLAHRGIFGTRVLDLFSGTGAVAIEALRDVYKRQVLDIDAFTGGYNLQAAFSTGYVAAMHITHPEAF